MVVAVAVASSLAVASCRDLTRRVACVQLVNQLHALTTVGQFAALAGILARVDCGGGAAGAGPDPAVVFLSAFSVVTLAMPLGATKLYLFGISVDQQFRTEYLTRLADSAGPHDMTYMGLPPYYPPGWFWLGGRLAALTGTPAWEMFKPWSIVTITAAIAVAFVLWRRMIRFETALVVTDRHRRRDAGLHVDRALRGDHHRAAAAGVRAGLVGAGARGRTRNGGWAAVGRRVGTVPRCRGADLHPVAGLRRFHFTIMAFLSRPRGRRSRPAAATARHRGDLGAMWLSAWGRGCCPRPRTGQPTPAPRSTTCPPRAALDFPMLQFTLLGALCMVGTVWLVVHARISTRAGALAIAVLSVYAWSLLSMLTTLVGTTLLSFRLQPTLSVLLSAAGAFGFIAVTEAAGTRFHARGRPWWPSPRPSAATVITFTQDIPDVLRSDINVAYTDTDGHGLRADRRPPGSEQYYRQIDAQSSRSPAPPRPTVVMTADYSFLSYYPYYGFQGLTSHYANPLAQFKERSAAIESWALFTAGPVDRCARHTAMGTAHGVPDAPRRPRSLQQLHTATGRRRLSEPAQRQALPGRTELGRLRRSALGRLRRRTVRAGDPPMTARDNLAALTSHPVVTPHDQPPNCATGGHRRGLAGHRARGGDPLLPVTQTTAQLNWPQNGTLRQRRRPADRVCRHGPEHLDPVQRRRRPGGGPATSCCPRCPNKHPRPWIAGCSSSGWAMTC